MISHFKIKTLFVLLFISLYSFLCLGQNKAIDSLNALLSNEKNEASRIFLLLELSYNYYHNPDTVLELAEQALSLSKKIGHAKGEAYALNQKGTYFLITENWPSALRHYLLALKISESLKDQELLGRNNMNIGNIFSYQEDYEKSIFYFKNAKKYADKLNDTLWSTDLNRNIGSDFEKLNLLDSARSYILQSYEYAIQKHDTFRMGLCLLSLGDIHFKMGQSKLSLEYYRLSLQYSLSLEPSINTDDLIGIISFGLMKLFNQLNEVDSAFHYAKISLNVATKLKRLPHLEIATFLTGYYKNRNVIDSAFNYQRLALIIKDSLFGQNKVKQIQILSLNEALRQEKIEEDLQLAKKERNDNIQMMGIGVFIISSLLVVVLFIKRRVNPKLIEVWGIISLLLLFEFIALLIHPFIAAFTHHTPILIFIILVVIAAILVPLHHKMEKFLKEILAHKITTNTIISPNENIVESNPND
jgi:tetratricopeptide (TPR) repeat protein